MLNSPTLTHTHTHTHTPLIHWKLTATIELYLCVETHTHIAHTLTQVNIHTHRHVETRQHVARRILKQTQNVFVFSPPPLLPLFTFLFRLFVFLSSLCANKSKQFKRLNQSFQGSHKTYFLCSAFFMGNPRVAPWLYKNQA